MDGDTLYIPVFDSQDVISVPIGPNHAADPEEVNAAYARNRSAAQTPAANCTAVAP